MRFTINIMGQLNWNLEDNKKKRICTNVSSKECLECKEVND